MFKRATKPIDRALQICLIGCIRLYRAVISPWMGMNCRFYPSCSQYALDSLRQHGGWRGGWLMMKRLLRCHPWHCGGYDPVKTEIKKVR